MFDSDGVLFYTNVKKLDKGEDMKLKDYRMSKNLTQEDLSKLLGIQRTTISMWEKNRAKPRLDMVFKLSRVLEVDVDDIVKIFSY